MPGSTRQSSSASATDGMTFTFGGSPTPERRLVIDIVDVWIALLNLLSASAPTRVFIVSTTRKRAAGIGSFSRRPSARIRFSIGRCWISVWGRSGIGRSAAERRRRGSVLIGLAASTDGSSPVSAPV